MTSTWGGKRTIISLMNKGGEEIGRVLVGAITTLSWATVQKYKGEPGALAFLTDR